MIGSGTIHLEEKTSTKTGREIVPAALILISTAALSLLWSQVRLLWQDEFLSFYSDSVPALKQVWHVQLHTPISLDPPTYHLLSHLSMLVLGRNAIALRFPAMLGFLLLQVCLYVLIRQLSSTRAALIGMLLPVCTASFRYSVEGRPYGLLLGLYALALLCWWISARRKDHVMLKSSRLLPLLGLTITIALAFTSHYFGILIVVPILLGEIGRALQRRSLDFPMLGAVLLGLAGILIVLPFKIALKPYQRHYYTSGVNLRNISQGYRELFIRYNSWPMPLQRVLAMLMVLATFYLLIVTFRRARFRPAGEPAYLWWALLGLLFLPFFGYLFGKFVTHTMEVRYVVAALIAFAIPVALVLERLLRSDLVFAGIFTALTLFGLLVNVSQIIEEQRHSTELIASLTVPASLHAELISRPGERLYTDSLNNFFQTGYYAPDLLVRSRLSFLYDETAEVNWYGHNTNAVTAANLSQFTQLQVTPYSEFLARPDTMLLDFHTGWEWVGRDLRARRISQQPLGRALSGDLSMVHGSGAREPAMLGH